MKALSVRQPWAWAIVTGVKTVENRTWRTRHRGPLLIHASRSRLSLADAPSGLLPGLPPEGELPFGALVGVVDVVDCVPVAEVASDPFAVGPWCWVLDAPRVFVNPVTWRGSQAIFSVPTTELQRAATVPQ